MFTFSVFNVSFISNSPTKRVSHADHVLFDSRLMDLAIRSDTQAQSDTVRSSPSTPNLRQNAARQSDKSKKTSSLRGLFTSKSKDTKGLVSPTQPSISACKIRVWRVNDGMNRSNIKIIPMKAAVESPSKGSTSNKLRKSTDSNRRLDISNPPLSPSKSSGSGSSRRSLRELRSKASIRFGNSKAAEDKETVGKWTAST
ncbi:hypothetical protein ASPZODRAFT_1216560 [Penicilliopsis zonata CBS 506.65]|uniref:Uncharacterized protein n=1 Tax=Penicilliopsis zonata CBS 506.65 TaxID=1073090 RepID=A0A1L9S7G5_9EURO|nr:hypothetical protein ASPZODRAFT_1216560 [Penicilliopsis zonata CBS 506.65]OJJ43098.1 hypothetical protein ASPZODRAFT_1216560 [Penicilliopsis zonata CBS 506.65]